MSVNNGQDANELNFNKAFGSKMADNTFAGVQALDSSTSGAKIINVQKCINTIMDVVGMSEIAVNNGDYENNNYIADGDTRKVAISKLDGALKALSDIVAQLNKPCPEDQPLKQIAAGGTIAVSNLAGLMKVRVEGAIGAVIMAAAPFGATPDLKDGAIIYLIGNDSAKPVGINYADIDGGCLINGDRVLNKGDVLALMWEATLKRLVQASA